MLAGPMDLIDTHVHLLDPGRFWYAWCAAVPALNRAFPLAEYRAEAAAGGAAHIVSAVFMEGDVPLAQQDDETHHFSHLANNDRDTLPIDAVIAGAWPESADFPGRLERLAADPRVRGVRRVLHTMPDDLSQTPRFAENLRLLAKYDLTFDLCVRPHLLPRITGLVGQCPETLFVLDHCGVPNVAQGERDPWRDDLRRLAAHPNAVLKFSGLASVCDPQRPMTPQVRPYLAHCLECFSPARVMWGSDWPLCNLTFDLAAWLETTAELLGELGETERSAIATDTARRVYRLP